MALVGLDQLTRRYPITPGLGIELLERWADEGVAIRLEPLPAYRLWAETWESDPSAIVALESRWAAPWLVDL